MRGLVIMQKLINFDIGIAGLLFQYYEDFGITKLMIIGRVSLIDNHVYIPTQVIILNDIKVIVNLLNGLHRINFEDELTTFGVGTSGIICQYFSGKEQTGLTIAEGYFQKGCSITISGIDKIKCLITKLENIVEGFDIDEN